METIKKTSKKGKIFWGAVIFLFAVMILELGWKYYDSWHAQKRVQELAQELERIEQARYDKMAGDTIGGKTPQETLRLFISAVEAGDYELASKYFVTEEQANAEKELLSLKEKNNIVLYLSILKKAEPEGEIKNGRFRMMAKLEIGPPDYLIDFIQYPSGNWKIEKI